MEHIGGNCDTYTRNGKMWVIAKRFNKDSTKHSFDRHGNQLTREVVNKKGRKEVVACLSHDKMLSRQCLKVKTLNVSRRQVSKSEYKPVGVL